MGLIKGSLDSGNKFTVNDSIRGLELIAVSTQPSFHVLETGDNVKWYMWINDSDEWIMHTSAPTASNRNSVGNIITGAGNSGANKTLSNLGTVVMTAILTPAATTTTDIGTSSKYFNDSYLGGKLYLKSDVTLDAGASARLDIVGDIQVGVDGTGNDITFFADTSGSYIKWSADGNTNVGTLLIQDDAMFLWGDSSDITMTWVNGGGFEIEAAADDNIIKFGGSTHVDVYFYNKSSTNDMGWIADSSTLQLSGAAVLHFGGSALDTITAGWNMRYDDSETLNVEPYTTGQVFRIGETIVADFHLDGTTYDVMWDASESEYLFNDNAKLVFGGTSDDAVIYSDGTLLQISLAGGGTTSGIVMHPYAAQTTALLHLDGATVDWNGASEVGMLHITGDTALPHAGASLVNITHATAAPITDADGFLLRMVSTGTARTNAYAVDLVVPVTQPALRVNSIVNITGVTTANAAVLQVTGNDATNDVYAVDFHNEGTAGVLKLTGDDTDTPGFLVIGQANHTVSLGIIDGVNANWIGADDVGMLHLKADTALADAGASQLMVVNTAKPINSAQGFLARFVDTGAKATTGTGYAVEIDTTNNSGLNIVTGVVTASNLVMSGLQAQTASIAIVDGDTGTGWIGAADVGMLHLKTKVAGADVLGSMLNVTFETGTAKASAEGYLARFVGAGGAAQAGAIAVNIAAYDATEIALNIELGLLNAVHSVTFEEDLTVGVNSTGSAGHVDIWDGTGSNTPAYVMLASTDGTPVYLFAANNGTLRYHSSVPTANTDGTQVNA